MRPRRPRPHVRTAPALAPFVAPQNEQERKERQRLYTKRNYYKKLNEMQTQRDRVRQLEDEYMRLVAQKQAPSEVSEDSTIVLSDPTFSPTDVDLLSDVDPEFLRDFDKALDDHLIKMEDIVDLSTTTIVCTQPSTSKRHQYMEISNLKEQLLAENQLLRDVITDHERVAQKLTSLMQAHQSLPKVATNNYGNTLVRPVTLAFCREVAHAAYEEWWKGRTSRDSVFFLLNVFGWHDKRLPSGKRVQYNIKKRFLGCTALELSSRAWNIFTVPKSMEALYSTSLNAKYSILQTVDDDNVIMVGAGRTPDGKCIAKSLLLVTRQDISNGVLIGFKSLDAKLVVPTEFPFGMSEVWVDHLSCVTFMSVGDKNEHCELELSGDAEPNPLVSQGEWLLEILFLILRFESQLIGPMFSLC